MNVFITGASGLLGSKVAELAAKMGHKVYSGYLTREPSYGTPVRLDVRDEAALRRGFEAARPEVVIHTAALTDVDRCEVDRGLAWSINVKGTENVARLSKGHGAFLIYISTDYVFKGDRGMYKETDEPEPANYYGLTKLEGEREVASRLSEFCIARSSVIYGARPASGKTNFALWVIEKLRGNEVIDVVVDQWNSPTLNTNLAEMILEVAEKRLTGVYHLAGASRISRYDFARLLAETFNLNRELIKPVTASKLSWKAKRPQDSSLDVGKAMKDLDNKPLGILDALRRLREEVSDL
ncbi:MAG: dTDP-4-dehydrorhamnose reductase [Candidatus Nezhaarchaeota archaeon]|nr:dTDP-4-dehydrorhamnose reductase [Candidatus Nezhaarchaeota archaeon]